MGIDIKIPIGLMFTILGLLLTIFGLFTAGDSELYAISLDVNVNLWSGMGMLILGLVMLFWGRKSLKKINSKTS